MASRTLSVVIAGDASGARAAFGQVEQGAGSLQSKLRSVGQSMMRFGAGMTAAVTLPLVLLGKTAFDAASDLNESLNKVNVVFGDNAREIKAWSKTAADSMLMSRQQALEAAGTFGAMFSAMGIGGPTAKDMSKSLVQLAADMASFNNASPEEMLVALRSGLAGEVEPLRRFGVDLSAAAVEQRALTMTGKELAEQLTMQDKIMARYAVILEQTSIQQGDVANTAGSAANRQKRLTAQFKDAMAILGQSLIPIFQQVAEKVAQIANWFSNLDPRIQQFIVYAGIAAAAIGPIVLGLGALITVIGVLASPIVIIGAAIAGLAAAAVLLYVKWDEVWSWMKDHPAIAALIILITGPVSIPIIALVGIIKFLQANWDTIWPAIQGTLEAVWSVVGPIFSAMDQLIRAIADAAAWLGGIAASVFGSFVRGAEVLWNAIDGPLGTLLNVLQKIVSAAAAVRDALPGGGGIGNVEDIVGGPSQQGYGGGSRQFRAAGGPVSPFREYVVGEDGPEILRMGASGGYVVPNHALGGPSVVVNVHGSVITERQLDEVVATSLARWQRHNGN